MLSLFFGKKWPKAPISTIYCLHVVISPPGTPSHRNAHGRVYIHDYDYIAPIKQKSQEKEGVVTWQIVLQWNNVCMCVLMLSESLGEDFGGDDAVDHRTGLRKLQGTGMIIH